MASRLIQPPPRSSIAGSLVIAVTFLVFSIFSFSFAARPWAAGFALMLAGAALAARDAQAFQFALLTALVAGFRLLHHLLPVWPFPLLVPIVFFLAFSFCLPHLRKSLFDWLQPGRFRTQTIWMVFAIAVVAGAALYLWFRITHPDVAVHLRNIPSMPLWLFPFAGIGFAVLNAAMEEFIFRGAVLQTLDAALGEGILSMIGQAWLFGALHYLQGFPNGAVGVGLATTYGILLGFLRRHSQGMFAPWLAHICADLVIFSILAGIVLKQ